MVNTLTPSELFLEAANILETKGWCRVYCAKDINGTSVSTMSESATQFCMIGGLARAAETRIEPGGPYRDDSYPENYKKAYSILEQKLSDKDMWRFNDNFAETSKDVVDELREIAGEIQNE